MNIRPYSNDQQLLFPPCVGDFLEENHLARFISTLVEDMDLSSIYSKISKVGNPRYSPKMLFKILIYAYCIGIYSSRKIGKALETDVAFIFRTISDFRKNNHKEFEAIFQKVLRYCLHLGLVKLSHIAVDGTVIKANASSSKNYDQARLEKLVQKIARKAEKIDKAEDSKYGPDKRGDELSEDLQSLEGLKKKVEELTKKFEEEDRKQSLGTKGKNPKEQKGKGTKKIKINSTDSDSKLQKNNKGYQQGYRLQVGVDDKEGIILAAKVVNSQSDMEELLPLLDQIENSILEVKEKGKLKGDTEAGPIELTADTGYNSLKNLKELSQRPHYDPYIASGKNGCNVGNKVKEFHKHRFLFHQEQNCYVCPEGQVLKYEKKCQKRGKEVHLYRCLGEICKSCPHFGKCTTSNQGRTVYRYVDESFETLQQEMHEKVSSEAGQSIYKKRKANVEKVFGDIKRNQGFREFSLRGLEKVRGEGTLVALCYNVRKMFLALKKKTSQVTETISEMFKLCSFA